MAVPRCPRHPKSKVWLDGSYGRPGHRRPRFRCVEGHHRFTEPLPRQRTQTGECEHCERPLASYEGAPAPRRQQFTTREIASTLIRVGSGIGYRAAARQVRIAAHRTRLSRDSSLVEDWIEIYAPVLSAALAPQEWPDVLLLDDSPFFIRTTGQRARRRALAADPHSRPAPDRVGKACVFRVFGALAYNPDGRDQMVRLEAFPDKTPESWQQFLTSLLGRPRLIICDNETGMLGRIARTWPTDEHAFSPIIFLSHWHVKDALRKLLKRYRYPDDGELVQGLGVAFANVNRWEEWVERTRAVDAPWLHGWLDARDPSWWAGDVTRAGRISWQLANMRSHPVSAGDLEAKLLTVKDLVHRRTFAFRNRERTNRMLSLMTLHLNGVDGEERYAKLLRQPLAANGGLAAPRKQITNPSRGPSLWRRSTWAHQSRPFG